MRKFGYSDNHSGDVSAHAFNSLQKSLGRPRQEEYDELSSTIHDSLCEEQLEVGVLNTLQASDFQFVINKCEYDMQCSFREDREKSGVPSLLLQIDHRNAEFVMYPEEPNPDSLPCGFHTDEAQSPQFSRLIDALVKEGAERNLLNVNWVRCMWRNIIWKQASKTKWTKRVESMKWSQVFKLMVWRYFNECYCAHPPPLKRLVQGDESEGRFIVLLVSDVVFVPPLPDYDDVPDPGTESEEKEKEKASLKQQIAENHLDDPDKLADLVRQAAEEMGITLTDEQVSQIVDLLLKLSKLDIDPDKLANQAKELYNKLESLGITVDKEKVGNFITNFVSSIWELIQSFLNQ